MMIQFTTKATTLQQLRPLVAAAKVLPIVVCKVGELCPPYDGLCAKLAGEGLFDQTLIVRSSAKNEDTEETSNAGKFLSIGNVCGKQALIDAVRQVADAMGQDEENEVFIQPYLQDVELCGVAFTADPNTGGNYYVINYDDKTGSTCSVTDGTGTQLEVYYHFKSSPYAPKAPLDQVIRLCQELETLFDSPCLDIEFAFDKGELYLFQVRPLILRKPLACLKEQTKALERIAAKVEQSMNAHPELYGNRTIYGVMPDWNPAEMIGVRPRPLALSLYKEIITNGVWAYQRDNYGYRNLRSFPLMVDFQGLPYIDTRISFNSFLPKDLPEELGVKLVNYYLKQLRDHPSSHDKVEFDIAFTCYTFDLPQRVRVLQQHGFTKEEQEILVNSLRTLTNSILGTDGLWKKDARKIEILQEKHRAIMESSLSCAEKIYWLLEYCKRYGTLPFAGLARAGFIAVELLRSMVSTGLLTEDERSTYMSGLSTIGKRMAKDRAYLSKEEFFRQYGHLRPGTYDICSPRYDQNIGGYFGTIEAQVYENEIAFKLSLTQFQQLQDMLEEHGLNTQVLALFDFIKGAIEGREYAKFVFTKALSDVLELLAQLGASYGLTREEMSYLDIRQVLDSYSSACDMEEMLRTSIQTGQRQEQVVTSLTLPPLLWKKEQVYSFSLPDGTPNFITQNSCTADAVALPSQEDIQGKLVLIRGADPGYDWIFSHNIAGFVTAYGGANSHMAIRAAEFGLPAVIGIGEKQFVRLSQAKRLRIDCRNRVVQIL